MFFVEGRCFGLGMDAEVYGIFGFCFAVVDCPLHDVVFFPAVNLFRSAVRGPRDFLRFREVPGLYFAIHGRLRDVGQLDNFVDGDWVFHSGLHN